MIEQAFKVQPADLEEAQAIVKPDAPAVFKMNERMCEPTTHRAWAMDILNRATIYGISEGPVQPLVRAV